MHLEKRVLILEKQVLLLKAKIKANDLWKQGIQSWINKTFKRSINEKLITDESSDAEWYLSDASSVEVDDGHSDYYRFRKRSRLRAPTQRSRRAVRVKHRPSSKVIRQTDKVIADSQAQKNTASTPLEVVSENHNNRLEGEINETEIEVIDQSRNEELEPEDVLCNEGDAIDEALVISTMQSLSDPDPFQGHDIIPENNSPTAGTSTTTTVETTVSVTDSPSSEKIVGPVQIRPDLKQYFEYCRDPAKPGGLKMACLVKGCNSKLSMHSSNRWANSIRHLGVTHKMPRYIRVMPHGKKKTQVGTS